MQTLGAAAQAMGMGAPNLQAAHGLHHHLQALAHRGGQMPQDVPMHILEQWSRYKAACVEDILHRQRQAHLQLAESEALRQRVAEAQASLQAAQKLKHEIELHLGGLAGRGLQLEQCLAELQRTMDTHHAALDACHAAEMLSAHGTALQQQAPGAAAQHAAFQSVQALTCPVAKALLLLLLGAARGGDETGAPAPRFNWGAPYVMFESIIYVTVRNVPVFAIYACNKTPA